MLKKGDILLPKWKQNDLNPFQQDTPSFYHNMSEFCFYPWPVATQRCSTATPSQRRLFNIVKKLKILLIFLVLPPEIPHLLKKKKVDM